ncbi:hypothetical protein FOE78_07085 [Microlunatus elymi]|uniref:Cellulose synthase subunit n=1 Tax=Microlunatus elymi TaxID=2596828 RepID=A0A516PX28_9ACTN|nr:hypothetical protein [Microlunatus elymi]QDP95702.1 hypothetical protein FOE78_07085 [Microlunatus elymi]
MTKAPPARRSLSTHLLAGLTTVAVSLSMMIITVPSAQAQPISFGLDQLGQSATLGFADSTSSQLVLPVPRGTRPDRLTGTAEISADGVDGRLLVSTGAGRLDSIDLGSKAGQAIGLDIDLSAVPVTGNAVSVTIQVLPRTGYCHPPDATGTVLRDLALSYSGSPAAPESIGEFLPPVLPKLILAVPDNVDADLGTAAARLATAITQRYLPAQPEISVQTGPVPEPSGLTRVIELTGSGDAGLALGSDTRRLQITGTGAGVVAQVAGLTGDLGTIATGSRATAAGRSPLPALAPKTQTLSRLGIGDVSARGVGRATLHLGVDRARIGGAGGGWTARLVGSVVAGASPDGTGRQGTLTLAADGHPLQTWPLKSGQLNLTATVPQQRIGRFTDLTLTAAADGASGCGRGPEVSLALDGDSTLAARNDPAGPIGLGQLPAALQPRFAIASGVSGVSGADGLGETVAMAVAMQRLTSAALTVDWFPRAADALATGRPTVLLAGNGDVPVDLPVKLDADGVTAPDGRRLDGPIEAGALQITESDGRPVVVEQATSAAIQRRFGRWLTAGDHLAGLTGAAAVWTGGDTAITFRTATRPSVEPTDDGLPAGWLITIGVAVGAAVIAAPIVLAVMIRRRRRR